MSSEALGIPNLEGGERRTRRSHFRYVTEEQLNHEGLYGWKVVSVKEDGDGITFAFLEREISENE